MFSFSRDFQPSGHCEQLLQHFHLHHLWGEVSASAMPFSPPRLPLLPVQGEPGDGQRPIPVKVLLLLQPTKEAEHPGRGKEQCVHRDEGQWKGHQWHSPGGSGTFAEKQRDNK